VLVRAINLGSHTLDLHLAGKTALITGASKGIGYASAEALAAEGCNVILVARNAADLDKARAEITSKHKVRVDISACDLSSGTDRLAVDFPDIDILVNNAGAIPGGSVHDIDEAKWRAAWELKVFGYINLTRAYHALMKARGRGVIINVIGTAGQKPTPDYIAGATGNAALMAFTRALGGKSLEQGVRVVGINPGLVRTTRLETLYRKKAQDAFGDPDRWQELAKTIPNGGPTEPEQVGALVAFLASDVSAATSGTIITIDKGHVNY
jgi:3-oxoacyl-[acyl-carrier protein] reductase